MNESFVKVGNGGYFVPTCEVDHESTVEASQKKEESEKEVVRLDPGVSVSAPVPVEKPKDNKEVKKSVGPVAPVAPVTPAVKVVDNKDKDHK